MDEAEAKSEEVSADPKMLAIRQDSSGSLGRSR